MKLLRLLFILLLFSSNLFCQNKKVVKGVIRNNTGERIHVKINNLNDTTRGVFSISANDKKEISQEFDSIGSIEVSGKKFNKCYLNNSDEEQEISDHSSYSEISYEKVGRDAYLVCSNGNGQ